MLTSNDFTKQRVIEKGQKKNYNNNKTVTPKQTVADFYEKRKCEIMTFSSLWNLS